MTFDTSVVLLLLGSRPREPDEPERLEQLIEDNRGKARLGIPAPVMAECGGMRLPDGFDCLDFTLEAAYHSQRFIVRLEGDKGGRSLERQRLELDALILGTSLAHGANALYTSNLRDFANMMKLVPQSRTEVLQLPKLREWQPKLDLDE